MTSGTSSILINGVEGSFNVRGVFVRETRFPYLFILVTDVFTRILNRGKDRHIIQGLAQFDNSIVTLQYADDTLLFSVTNNVKLANLKLLLYLFENASSLNINFSKSISM